MSSTIPIATTALSSQPTQSNAVGAQASMRMDFSHEDRAPTEKLNVLLWKDAMGSAPVPPMLKVRAKKTGDGDVRRQLARGGGPPGCNQPTVHLMG